MLAVGELIVLHIVMHVYVCMSDHAEIIFVSSLASLPISFKTGVF